MPKSKRKSKKSKADFSSPLTSGTSSNEKKKRPKNLGKRGKKEALEDQEEERLTSLIFGGGDTSVFDANNTVTNNNTSLIVASNQQSDTFEIDRAGEGFEIDRSADNAGNEDDDDDDAGDDESSVNEDSRQLEHEEDDEEESDEEVQQKGAWVDDDDQELEVNIVDSSLKLKKLRQSRGEEYAKALDGEEFEQRLRKRYEDTAQRSARTDWASIDTTKPTAVITDEDHDDENEQTTTASVLATSKHRLPQSIIKMVRCPDVNLEDPNHAVVQSVQFHPGSDPDQPLVLTAGLDKTLRFFQVNAEKSTKIHGIHFPKFPIHTASFLGNTGNVVLSGRRKFFYMYDAIAGKVDLIPRINGRDEKSFERHVSSPDGKLIVFLGNDGYLILVDAYSKHWIANLKVNGSVRAVTFTPDGQFLMASGSDGEIYRWDLNSRTCVERFSNNEGTISSSMACSSKTLAVGAESGVVNLYSEYDRSRKCLKSVMNLRTSADRVKFNHDGQILAMSSQRDKNSLRLLHVPSQTVFSNWPTSKTPLGYAWSMDFSPESKFLAVGNDKGKCLLYQVSHFHNDDDA